MTDAIRIEGALHEDALLGYTPGNGDRTAVLSMEIRPKLGMPYRIIQALGTEPAAHKSASAKLPLLKRGAEVVVYAQGLRIRTDHGITSLVPMQVTGVYPKVLPNHLDTTSSGGDEQ